MFTFLTSVLNKIKAFFSRIFTAGKKAIDKRPFISFLVLLALLLGAVVANHALEKPSAPVSAQVEVPLPVHIFQLGTTPRIQMSAKIEKSGVIKLYAQSGGVVQKIFKKEGDHVTRGKTLFSLSTNYQGGNIATVNRQIAQKNYQFLQDNFDTQKDIIGKQRAIANTTETQAEQLRSITQQSLSETSSLIDLDNSVIASLDAQITNLQGSNVGGVNDATILQSMQSKSGILTGLNIARTQLRNNQYQADNTKEPAQLATISRDLTLRQLDLQEKTLDLNKDLSHLNLRIMQINESLMYPASPCPATVERIYVKVGQNVTPGTLLASLRGDMNTADVVALVSADTAKNISRVEPSFIQTDSGQISVLPRYISQEPTDGTLLSVLYSVPEENAAQFSDGSIVHLDVPVGVASRANSTPYIPLDAVYQTQDSSYVYVVSTNDKQQTVVKNRPVTLGTVYGDYVEVQSGLSATDKVVLDRNVVEGAVITPQQ